MTTISTAPFQRADIVIFTNAKHLALLGREFVYCREDPIQGASDGETSVVMWPDSRPPRTFRCSPDDLQLANRPCPTCGRTT